MSAIRTISSILIDEFERGAMSRKFRWTGLLAGLLVLGVLGLRYVEAWYGVAAARVSKEAELAMHLAELGMLASEQLEDELLQLRDLAFDSRWLAQSGADGNRADALTYYAESAQRLVGPLEALVGTSRVERLVVLDPEGRVLWDTAGEAVALGSFDYLNLDGLEFEQAVGGEAAGTPYYQADDTGYKRVYVPVASDASGEVEGVLCLMASRAYLTQIERLGLALRRSAVLTTILMGLIALLIAGLILRQRRMERRAAEADRLAALGTLAAGFAHELRNPLGIIRAFTEDLQRDLREGRAREDALEACEEIVEEVDRLNRLVGQFLTYSRGGSDDGRGGQPGWCRPRDILESVSTMLRASSEKKEVGLELDYEGQATKDQSVAGIAPGALRQIAMNLILNAVQASPAGRSVRLELKAERQGYRLDVMDEGPGIGPKEARRLFEPFYTTREGGSGLGLAVSRRLAEEAGGRLELTSAGGRGRPTCFTLWIPYARESEINSKGVKSS